MSGLSGSKSAVGPSCATLGVPTLNSATPTCDGTTPSVVLSWTGVTGASNYKIYRDSALIYTTTGAGTTFQNEPVTAGQTYSYQVAAVSGSTVSGLSGSKSAVGPSSCTGGGTMGNYFFSQRASGWNNTQLGTGIDTIGKSGCALTCVAMLLKWANGVSYNVDPSQLNDWLKANGGYNIDLIYWDIAANYDGTSGLQWVGRTDATDDWASLDSELAAGNKPIVSVKYGGTGANHFVIVYERSGASGIPSSYKILDPNDLSFDSTKTLGFHSSASGTIYGLRKYSAVLNTSLNGTISLTVSLPAGEAASDINAVLLFNNIGAEVSRKAPPNSNPISFTSTTYGTYHLEVYCWDMLAAQSSTFSHNAATTPVTATTNAKRPLNTTVYCSDGTTKLPNATIYIDSYNGQYGTWTPRASGTTDSSGNASFSAYPTTQSDEYYQIRVNYGGSQVKLLSFATVVNTSIGSSYSITTPVSSAPVVPTVTLSSPNGGETCTAGTTRTVTWSASNASQISYYYIDYSLDGGNSWINNAVYASASATSASWLIPSSAVSAHARVRIRALNSSSVQIASKTSASDFSISAQLAGNPTAVPQTKTIEPVFGTSGTTVYFTGHNSTGSSPSCGVASYLWDFGDGATSTATDPSHTYYCASSASYPVSLRITDCNGTPNQHSITVRVTGQGLGNSQSQTTTFSKDPVNLATGNYIYDHVDLRITGRGLPFEFKRFYNSKDTTGTGVPLGFGWTHSYNINVSIDVSNNAVIAYGDGHREIYAPNGSGGYISEPGIFNTLTSGGGAFTLTTKEQQKYFFNASGRLSSIADKNANTITLTYSGSNLATITDAAGRAITFTSDANGRLTQITDPLGRTVQYAYDANTNLVTVTDLRGNVTQFAYDAFHQITSAIDPRGNTFVTMVYDPLQRIVSLQKDALQNPTQFDYDFVNGVTTVTDAAGNKSYNYYDDKHRIIRIVDNAGNGQNFEYDANNNRTKVVDKNGNVTSYAYDPNGNVISKVEPLGSATTISYDSKNNPTNRLDALGGTMLFNYDSNGNLIRSVNALGKTNSFAYDAFGQPTAVTDPNGNSTTNTYDSFGNLIRIQNALGGVTSNSFDVVSRKIAQVDALGRTTRFIYDYADNLTSTVNALGQTNSFTFDANNNRIAATDYLGNTTTSAYDQKDRLVAVRDPLGGSITNAYDKLDLKISVTDARGGVMQYGYDAVGNLTSVTNATGRVTRYTYDPNGNRASITDPLGNVTTNAYDALNRVIATADALWHSVQSTYDALGRRIQTIDALSHTNSFSYDALGRLINFTDAAGGTVTYAYDNVGNRISTTDPNGHTTTSVYDALNRLVRTTDPLGGVSQFTYDAVGNLISKTDPKGQVITYQYDANNRRTRITYPTGTPVTFAYDANGNRVAMTDSLGTTAYSYDVLNRLTSVTDCYGKTVAYGYDRNGNRVSLTYPGSKTVTYAYDAMNRLTTVTDWLSHATTYNYDANGNLFASANPNGTAANYRYDAANRLVSLTNSAPNSVIISAYRYTLDALGNHAQVDQVEQLPTTPVVENTAYTYDNDNRLVTLAGQSQTFDANGNLTAIGSANSLAYDYENRLTQTVFAGTTNTFQYSGTGSRMNASRSGAVTRYVLDVNSPLTQVLAETDAGGTITAYNIFGLGLISRIDINGNAQYYHFDSRGSTVALTDASGQITEAYAYDPFGRPINGTISDNRFRYLGRHGVIDEENGLLYIRARYYSTLRGRFVTKDPTTGKDGDSQSLNRYIYALNNPVRLIDVSGLSPKESGGTASALATSDSSLFHNILISPSSNGHAPQNSVTVGAVSYGAFAMQNTMTASAYNSVHPAEASNTGAPQVGFFSFVWGRVSSGAIQFFDYVKGTDVSTPLDAISKAQGLNNFAQDAKDAQSIPTSVHNKIDCIVDGTCDVPTTEGGLYMDQIKQTELKLIQDGVEITY